MARILVADDEAPMRDLMSLACQMDGHVVQTTSDTPSTIAAYLTWKPDLMLLDLSMPGGGGMEVLRQVRFAGEGVARCPVVVVSGILDQVSDTGLEGLGTTSLVTKPFSLDQLRTAVRRALLGSSD